jgi:quinone-modifying oxidoreductase subunit QmoC
LSAMPIKEKNGAPISYMTEVSRATPGNSRLEMCIQCGTCGGSCPSADDMDHTPRQLFAMIRADMRDAVLASNTPWHCVSCYYCTVRCPQEIHITDIMYTLKSMAVAAGQYKKTVDADFSESFVGYVDEYGRSFELGLATRMYLRHSPLSIVKTATMGLGMLTRDRLDFSPQKIKNLDQLQSILHRAEEIEEALA